ncbi:MAG: hypothetical protein ACRDFS_11015, partial [Chloroflexota bacterium]
VSVLEDLGLVRQLHTSGGRVPSNAGYQYYIKHLMPARPVSGTEARRIKYQFQKAHPEVQEWLRLAAMVMARRMHNIGLVTAPKSVDARLQHLELVAIQSAVVLLLVVLQDGSVWQEMMPVESTLSQEELGSRSRRLNDLLRGLAAPEIETRLAELQGQDGTLAEKIANLVRRGAEAQARLYHAGLENMLRQPEFVGRRPGDVPSVPTERLTYMVEFLHQGSGIENFLSELPGDSDVEVLVGGSTDRLSDYSFVIGRYGDSFERAGMLGILGPTRMEYPRAVGLVRYMTGLMTDLMEAY